MILPHPKTSRMIGIACLYGLIFAGFIVLYERHVKRVVMRTLEEHSLHLADLLWDMARAGTVQYLDLVCQGDSFRSLQVYHADGTLFASSTNAPQDRPWHDFAFSSYTFPERPFDLPVFRGERRIGRLEARWINTNLLVYLYASVVLLLVLVTHALVWISGRARQSRRQAEERLEISRRRLESVVSTAPILVFSLDANRRFELCRGRALDQLGWSRDQFTGRSIADVEAQWPGLGADYQAALQGGTHTVLRRLGGRVLEVRYAALPMAGPSTGVLGVATDVTELEEAMEELKARDERLRAELDLAREIQAGLMPLQMPGLPGCQSALLFRPSIELSGDVIQLVQMPGRPHEIKLVLADITGHGVAAALLSMMFKVITEQVLSSESPLHLAMTELNERLCQQFPQSYFAATQLVHLDADRRLMHYVNASQQSILLWREGEGVRALSEGGAAPGLVAPWVAPELVYRQASVELRSGDYLLLFTDGLVEAWNEVSEEVGSQRVSDWFAELHTQAPEALLAQLWQRVTAFAGTEHLPDDVAAVAIRITGD